jgi:hypothetical protein
MKFLIAFLFLIGAAVPSAVSAQVDDQFSWGLTGGAAVPARDLADNHNTGVSGGVTFAFGNVGQLIGIRVDGLYNTFPGKSGTDGKNARIMGGTFNLVTSLIGTGDRVYVIGGVGGYGIRTGVQGVKAVNDFGINGGMGVWLPFASAFIEARYHHFYRALANKQPAPFIPITVGILF